MPSGSELMDRPNKINFLYILFGDLLTILVMCLDTMEEWDIEKKYERSFQNYLVILKELHDISKLYQGGKEYFWTNLRDNKISFCYLIVRYAKWGEDYEWILEHKDLLNFETRRHLVILFLPRIDKLHLYKMLIDRSQLLVESFEDIAHTEPNSLHAELSIKFKDEEATGHGVLREWFFLLAENNVSLEDIRDADNQILDMDPLEVDKDVLGLTFVWSIGESGSMKDVELCPCGINIMVNSRNKKKYVDLVIHHGFVQIIHFARGFFDIVGEEIIQRMCFGSLELKDFDGMLHGSENDISIEDWKTHIDYHGYLQTGPEICWFWKIIEGMTAKQRKALRSPSIISSFGSP
ncbi:hypothetical protein L6452_21963 [Arctium lappa]|uniref:Uncharacterized protein n=1 Tax=Arctium lappa TaxID=4217 RepID=A0ACB9B2T9_ARCLA|nr:hypothetical protein L6452_21963 [Arctium lappa]